MPFCMASRTTADKEGTTGVEHILLDFGLILGAGLLAQLLATLLRIPEMIVLVAVGALIGPSVLGIASNPLDEAGAQLIFTLGVSLILFHGRGGHLAASTLAGRRGTGSARPAGRPASERAKRPAIHRCSSSNASFQPPMAGLTVPSCATMTLPSSPHRDGSVRTS
jgi:hypothetical protein